MTGKVKLDVISGPKKGAQLLFEEYDTFIFGRMEDCHISIPGDALLSRHHFILEVNPPDVTICDLGSLNGTFINGVRYGGRGQSETPEQALQKAYPKVQLHNGDEIKTGSTRFQVTIEVPEAPTKTLFCQQCGKDVTVEAGTSRGGDYMCEDCRRQAEKDPLGLLQQFLKNAQVQSSPGSAGPAPLSEKTPGGGHPKEPAEQPPMQLQPPQQPVPQRKPFRGDLPFELPGYDFVKTLGVGGCGAVYLLQSIQTGQKVALKLMLPKIAAEQQAKERFLRETEISKGLEHANIVRFYSSGVEGSIFYFTMEYCEGGSLEEVQKMQGGRFSVEDLMPWIIDALEGLDYAHKHNIVHRDLKPANILLKDVNGRWVGKIGDLGLAKNFTMAGLSGMTFTGGFAGTTLFMPREQLTNFKYVKPVSDVWAMGACIYNLLTGQYPREFPFGKDPAEVILHGQIVPVRKRDSSIPRPLAEVIDCSLVNNPDERFQDAGQFLQALRAAWNEYHD